MQPVFGLPETFAYFAVSAVLFGTYFAAALLVIRAGTRRWSVPGRTLFGARFREDMWRGLIFLRWWAALLLPVLLALPGALGASVAEASGRFEYSFMREVLMMIVFAAPLGLLLTVVRVEELERYSVHDK